MLLTGKFLRLLLQLPPGKWLLTSFQAPACLPHPQKPRGCFCSVLCTRMLPCSLLVFISLDGEAEHFSLVTHRFPFYIPFFFSSVRSSNHHDALNRGLETWPLLRLSRAGFSEPWQIWFFRSCAPGGHGLILALNQDMLFFLLFFS